MGGEPFPPAGKGRGGLPYLGGEPFPPAVFRQNLLRRTHQFSAHFAASLSAHVAIAVIRSDEESARLR